MGNTKFTADDYQKYDDGHVYGRVRKYDPEKGYGFIFSEYGKDIFFSSFALSSRKDEKHIFLGTVVKFIIRERERGFCAENIEVIDYADKKDNLVLPNGEAVPVRRIASYGIISGSKACEISNIEQNDIAAHNIAMWELGYVFILLRGGGQYHIHQSGSRIKGDGQVDDLRKYVKQLDKRFLFL